MSVAVYTDLSSHKQDAVQEAKLLVQKTLPVKPGIEENDIYAVFARASIEGANFYPPVTNYSVGSSPLTWHPLIVLGCRLQAYKYLETFWVEVPNLATAGVPYADRTQYMQRWKTLYDQLEPTFRRAVAQIKQLHFPGNAILVSTYQPDVLLRGMYEWPKYWRY